MAERYPRSVLLTTDTVGGVFTYAAELAAGLLAHGTRVVLATMGEPLRPAQRRLLARHGAERGGLVVKESRFRLEWQDEAWDDVDEAGEWLLSIAEEEGVELVHLNGYCHAALPWERPTVVVAHSCVVSWFRAVKGENPPPSYDVYRERVREGLLEAGRIVAPTRAMLSALEAAYGPLPPGRVVPNAADPARFFPGVKEPRILGAGRAWDEAKNVAVLAEVVPRLSWPVYCAGPVLSPDGRRAPEASGLRMLGPLEPDAMARELARASVFVHPARYEPFGLSVLEAAMSGCALVLGAIPSLEENWSGAAVFVPPDDADALAEALERLARRDDERRELAARARERALTMTPGLFVRRMRSIYRELLEAAPPRRRARFTSRPGFRPEAPPGAENR